jgi:hypothetical protein
MAAAEIGAAPGARAERNFMKYAKEFSAMMAGGEIPEEDRTAAFLMIASAYNQATEIAKEKYTPKRYRKTARNPGEAGRIILSVRFMGHQLCYTIAMMVIPPLFEEQNHRKRRCLSCPGPTTFRLKPGALFKNSRREIPLSLRIISVSM